MLTTVPSTVTSADDNKIVQRHHKVETSTLRRRSNTGAVSVLSARSASLTDRLRRPLEDGLTGFGLYKDGVSEASSHSSHPPRLMSGPLLVRVYHINHHWKSLLSKLCILSYMSAIFWILFRQTTPWYEFFFYLTLQGWTLEIIYFLYSAYLDVLSRWYGGPHSVSPVSKAAAQALSELVFALQVVIVMFFWLVVYPEEKSRRDVLWELNCHGMGLLLMIGDYLYRVTGFSMRNHRYILVFALSYATLYTFIVLYLKRTIYPGIDFRSVRSVLIFLSGVSTVVITHKVFYLISNWKWIKEEVKSIRGISRVIFIRQNSIDMFTRPVTNVHMPYVQQEAT